MRYDSEDSFRASDDERDNAAEVVRRGYAEGRLTGGELEERIDAAYGAKTQRELEDLVSDLPAGSLPGDQIASPGGSPLVQHDRGLLWCSDQCLILTLLFVFPPAGIVYWVVSMRGRRRVPR